MDLCREHGISEQTIYNWKSKYEVMDMHELKQVKEVVNKSIQSTTVMVIKYDLSFHML